MILKKRIDFILLLLIALLFVSCVSNKTLQGIKTPLIKDCYNIQDVNNIPQEQVLPDHVYIRTLTQSYCKYFEFALADGRIYSRKTGDSEWKLFLKTGLPFCSGHKKLDRFETPSSIVELGADGDTLYAFDDQGYFYNCFLASTAPEKPFRWKKLKGFPQRPDTYLRQNDLVLNKRGWSIGARRSEILWYEDAAGNQHHYGTMGIETYYFLTEDGQHIRFTDSGLTPDFSRSIQTPLNGSFIAENISASGDTIFLIGNKGSMFTRLIDFDTMGCDPMFIEYTYKKLNQKYKGSEYLSNYSPWYLPAEEWKEQSEIPLSGKARLSKMISIAQTGKGNEERELRVAGLNSNGETGFYHKMLNDEGWSFTKAKLYIAEEAYLDSLKSEIGNENLYSYSGYLMKNDTAVEGVRCELKNATLTNEDKCILTINYGPESYECILYNVEKWTYVLRYNPGLDGTARFYFGTLNIDESAMNLYSKEFKEILLDMFKGKNLKLFALSGEATDEYFQLDFEGQVNRTILNPFEENNKYIIFMTKNGIKENISPFVYKAGNSLKSSAFMLPSDKSLTLMTDKAYSVRDRRQISYVIENNRVYKNKLEYELKSSKNLKKQAKASRFGYSVIEFITKITLLNNLNFPKIKQMTSFGGSLLSANEVFFNDMAEYNDWAYPCYLELIEQRLKHYPHLIEAFDKNVILSSIDKEFCNTFEDYYKKINLPLHIEKNDEISGEKWIFAYFTETPYLPWFYLYNENGSIYIIKAINTPELIEEGHGTKENPLIADCQIRRIDINSSEESVLDLRGKISWDSNCLEIYGWNKKLNKYSLFSYSK